MNKIGNRQNFRTLLKIAVAIALLTLIGRDIYHSITEENFIEYYSRAPLLLLIPVGIACLVGLVIWLVTRLSTESKRRVLLWGWGTGNVVVMCYTGWLFYMVSIFVRLERSDGGRMVVENAGAGWIKYAFGLKVILLVAGLLVSWWGLLRTLKLSKVAVIKQN